MAATTAMANEVAGCTKDDKEDKARQRRQYWRTQETREMVKEGGQATLMVREGSKPLRCRSLPNTGYIYEGGG